VAALATLAVAVVAMLLERRWYNSDAQFTEVSEAYNTRVLFDYGMARSVPYRSFFFWCKNMCGNKNMFGTPFPS
jgi:hypothetical protein